MRNTSILRTGGCTRPLWLPSTLHRLVHSTLGACGACSHPFVWRRTQRRTGICCSAAPAPAPYIRGGGACHLCPHTRHVCVCVFVTVPPVGACGVRAAGMGMDPKDHRDYGDAWRSSGLEPLAFNGPAVLPPPPALPLPPPRSPPRSSSSRRGSDLPGSSYSRRRR